MVYRIVEPMLGDVLLLTMSKEWASLSIIAYQIRPWL